MYYRIGEVHLLQSRNDEAIASLEKARSANLELAYVHAFLASAYSLEGETELAAPSSAQLVSSEMVIQASPNRLPDFSVSKTRSLFAATYFAGLRESGMPEE
jgi:hypothetical protein